MKPSPFFLAATIVESWFKGKTPLFIIPAKMAKKSRDFIKDHSCALIQIPQVHPLMRKLFLCDIPVRQVKSKRKPHTFQLDSDCLLHFIVDSLEQTTPTNDQSGFSKKFIDKPFKEHLLAKKRLEQVSQQPTPAGYSTSVFSSDSPKETPQNWIFSKKEEERQFQIDRVIKYPASGMIGLK